MPLAPNRNSDGSSHGLSQLVLHQRQPVRRLLGRANAARRLESHRHARPLGIVADAPHHHQRNRQRRVHAFLARRSLDKVRPGHHRHPTGPRHVAQRHQVAGAENRLHVHVGPARLAERRNFVVERLPLAVENMRARNDNVDLLRARFHRAVNLLHALGQRIQPRRKPRRNCSHRNARSFKRLHRRLHKHVIHAHRAHGQVQVLNAETLHNVPLQRIARLGAQPPHALDRVVAAQRGQVHARNGAQQPRRLGVFFHRAPRHLRRRAPLHRAGVHPHLVHPVQIERHAPVGFERAPVQNHRDGLAPACAPLCPASFFVEVMGWRAIFLSPQGN